MFQTGIIKHSTSLSLFLFGTGPLDRSTRLRFVSAASQSCAVATSASAAELRKLSETKGFFYFFLRFTFFF